jgi:hypothetical protein
MRILVQVDGDTRQWLQIPECGDVAFKPLLESGVSAKTLRSLDDVWVASDEVYGDLFAVGEIEFLAEARPIVAAIKEGLEQRLIYPLVSNEELRLR